METSCWGESAKTQAHFFALAFQIEGEDWNARSVGDNTMDDPSTLYKQEFGEL